MDLSIIIPARNEEFLPLTIEDINKNKRGNTETIVILDGYWPDPSLPDFKDVTIIHHDESIGQRAATNEGVRTSKAKYIIKCDAHCSFDEGFDVKLMQDCKPDWTVIPRMYNLHVFNWECPVCGLQIYQGAKPDTTYIENIIRKVQEEINKKGKKDKLVQTIQLAQNHINNCSPDTEFERVLVWQPRWNHKTDFTYFDKNLRFQYWLNYKKRKEARGNISNVMGNLGACFFMERDRYFEIEGLDEAHGSWGQVGTEISCKSWLSGGKQVVNKKTWFSHMFRTNNGFSFPYKISGKDQEKARKYSRSLWLNNNWRKQKYELQWLVDKFAPVPTWHEEKRKRSDNMSIEISKNKDDDNDLTILYITANKESESITKKCQKALLNSSGNCPIISISHKPIEFGDQNICVGEVGYSQYNVARQMLLGAKAAKTKYVAKVESDCLYPPEHFKFKPTRDDQPFFNRNIWLYESGVPIFHQKNKPSLCSMIANREWLIEELERRLEGRPEWTPKLEHGKNKPPSWFDGPHTIFGTIQPVINIQHPNNMHKRRITQIGIGDSKKELPYWGKATNLGLDVIQKWYHYGFKVKKYNVENLYNDLHNYAHPGKRDKQKPGNIYHFREVFTDFVKKILSDEQFDYISHPYYEYLVIKLNPADKFEDGRPKNKGHRHVLKKMDDAKNLTLDIRDNGMHTPLDIYPWVNTEYLERGGRRLVILHELGIKNCFVRYFESREMARRRSYIVDPRSNGPIEIYAAKQFIKYGKGATNKYFHHNYTWIYDKELAGLYNSKIKILEFGVQRGPSLKMWRDVFPRAQIFGVDIVNCRKAPFIRRDVRKGTIKLFTGSQTDPELHKQLLEHAPFDLIIDDASHEPEDILCTLKAMWPSLRKTGKYVIEDIWHHNKKHHEELNNKIKSMIDEIYLTENVLSVSIYPNIVFLTKGVL